MLTQNSPDHGELHHRSKMARLAGLLLILNLLVPLLNWGLVLSPLSVENDAIASARNILENTLAFRLGLAVEVLLSIGLVLLAVLLYKILSPAGKTLALLALSLKIAEATLMAVTVLIPYAALQAFSTGLTPDSLNQDQLLYPIGIIFNAHTALAAIPMTFLGIDMVMFSYLFLRSRVIPPCIAKFGILAFGLIFIHAFLFIIVPGLAVQPIVQMIFWIPSGIFEIVAGQRLLFRGVGTRDTRMRVPVAG